MRKFSLAALFALATPLFAQDYWCLNNPFSIDIDYGYIRRQNTGDVSLVKQLSIPIVVIEDENLVNLLREESNTKISSEDLQDELGWQSAIFGKIWYHVDACHSWEGVYTYYFPWSATETKRGENNLFFPFRDVTYADDYIFAFKAKAHYDTRMQNGEFNYWGHLTPQRVDYFSFSWTAGFRFLYLKDRMKLTFFREEDHSPYRIHTINYLYGAQLGAMLQINPSRCWTWTFMVKGAGFFNDAENRLRIRDQDNQITLCAYDKCHWTDSWLLEGYGELAYHWNSCISTYFAYQGFLVNGVVLAPNQIDKKRTCKRRIRSEGTIIVDGARLGFDFSF